MMLKNPSLSSLLFLFFAITFNVLSQNSITSEFDNHGDSELFYPDVIIDSVIKSPNIKNTLMAKVKFVGFQGFVRFEYFFNTDPGEGKGTPAFYDDEPDGVTFELDGISSKGVGSECGLNKLYIRAKDENGWSYPQAFHKKVNVPDSSPPVVEEFNPKTEIKLNSIGEAILKTSDIKYKASDNCTENVKVKFCKNISNPNQLKFSCDDIGKKKTINVCFEDDYGNYIQKNFSLEIKDEIIPTASAKDIDVYLNNEGIFIIKPQDINSNSKDNCSDGLKYEFKVGDKFTESITFNCSNIGKSNKVTLKVTDISGNSSTAFAIVNVIDTISPKVVIKEKIIKPLGKDGTVTINPKEVIAQASDNCGIKEMTLKPSKFTCDNLGKVMPMPILTVRDNTGKETKKEVSITITANGELPDNIPVKNDAKVSLGTDGTGELSLEQVYDENNPVNCLITKVRLIKKTFNCSDLKKKSFAKLRVENNSGSKYRDIDVEVIVIDKIKPNVSVHDTVKVYLNHKGEAKVLPKDVNKGSTDNCISNGIDYEFEVKGKPVNSIKLNCKNVGKSNPVKLRVTDESGNYSSSKEVFVEVLDTITPIVTLKEDVFEIDLENKDSVTITPNDVVEKLSDNCSTQLSLSRDTFSCMDSGNLTDIDLFVTNKEDTLLVKKVPIKVIGTGGLPDELPTKKDIEIELGENGKYVITTDQVYDSSNGKSCAKGEMTVSPSIFNCSSINKTILVTLSMVKGGETRTGEAKVTVVDNTKPTVSAKDLTLDLKGQNELVITASDIDTGSSDNCGIESKTISLDRFKRAGDYPITYTVTDASGNEASTSVLVKVIDSTITDGVSIQQNSDGETITILYDNLPQRLFVYNILGQLMFKTYTVPKTMPVAHLGSGLYFFNFVTSSGEKALLKVLVK